MRVITGSARGRKLETLPGSNITRPTAQSVKEAIFSMIQFEIEDRKILDLFAGSAQLGIEALSRGAQSCTFIEHNKEAAEVAKRNIIHCGFEDKSNLIITDALTYVLRKHSFDIAFLDPPYKQNLVTKTITNLIPSINDDGIIICETSYDEELPDYIELDKYRERRYSKTKITVYRKKSL